MADGEKRRYLVCYDYGMGGLWAVFRAHSAGEIQRVYPELTVFEEPPPWMNRQTYDEHLREREEHDLDGAVWGILAAVVADRS